MSHRGTIDGDVLIQAAMLRWFNELADQGIFTTDAQLVIRSWNRRLELHTGRLAADVVGRPLLETFPDLVTRRLDEHYRAALAGEPRVLSHRFHHYLLAARTGESAQTARIAPLSSDHGIVGTITVIDDVVDRVASERELRARIEAAEAARAIAENAVQVKDEFLATLSHEIRTPLNAVLGWTKILLSREVDQPALTRALQVIDRNAVAQMRLIDDMLDMARVMSGKLRLEMQPVDLSLIALAAVDVVSPTANAKGLGIVTEVPETIAMIGDADRLQQVVWNLLTNAVKFTEPGGTVTLRIASSPLGLRLTVSDTGCGIAPEFLPHVFDRFRQADPSASRRHSGLGLGLALVRQLVELHGGTVQVTSVRGEGSSFAAVFPTARPRATAEAAAAATPAGSLRGLRVLTVEEPGAARAALVTALEAQGVEVHVADDSGQALDRLDGALSDGSRPDAIVADIGLPLEEGYVLIERLRQRPPSRGGDIPAIAVTSFARPRDRKRALAAGFRAHLTRPEAPEKIAATLLEVAARKPRV